MASPLPCVEVDIDESNLEDDVLLVTLVSTRRNLRAHVPGLGENEM